MRIAISRVILFATGLTLLLAALLPSMAGSVGAAPPMLITETTPAEPPIRTSTKAPATNTALPAPTATSPAGPPSTATSPAGPTSTITSPSATPILPGEPTDVPRDPGRSDPTFTPTLTPTLAPTLTPELTGTPVSTPIVQISDPAITKSANRSTVKVGDTVEFTIKVTNLGNATASEVVVEDTLPSFLALSGASATRGDVSVSGSTVRVTIGDLAPGETVTITITARVVATAKPPNNSNIATVSSGSPTDDPGNNSSSVSLITEAAPPARLPNTGSPDGPDPLLLAAFGLGLIVLSLLARRRKA